MSAMSRARSVQAATWMLLSFNLALLKRSSTTWHMPLRISFQLQTMLRRLLGRNRFRSNFAFVRRAVAFDKIGPINVGCDCEEFGLNEVSDDLARRTNTPSSLIWRKSLNRAVKQAEPHSRQSPLLIDIATRQQNGECPKKLS